MDELIQVSGVEMEQIIHTREATEEDVIVQVSGELKRICAMAKEKSEQLSTENFFDQFKYLVRPRLQSDLLKWIPWYNEDDGHICLFSFGLSPGTRKKSFDCPGRLNGHYFCKRLKEICLLARKHAMFHEI